MVALSDKELLDLFHLCHDFVRVAGILALLGHFLEDCFDLLQLGSVAFLVHDDRAVLGA
jgi:hypothetical protein